MHIVVGAEMATEVQNKPMRVRENRETSLKNEMTTALQMEKIMLEHNTSGAGGSTTHREMTLLKD